MENTKQICNRMQINNFNYLDEVIIKNEKGDTVKISLDIENNDFEIKNLNKMEKEAIFKFKRLLKKLSDSIHLTDEKIKEEYKIIDSFTDEQVNYIYNTVKRYERINELAKTNN